MSEYCDNPIDIGQVPEPYSSNWIIVCAKTGIYWEDQCDHFACKRPRAEGFIFPFIYHNGHPDPDKEWTFVCPEDLCELSSRWTEEDRKSIAYQIDEALKGYNDVDGIVLSDVRFNYGQLELMMEGWIPILFNLGGLPRHGYLCSGNCD
jgi:hypothetical protein